uniref:Phospholysine phosphohistidine inorganic pyrophosphate phosphatase n=2 Tax=Hirondellea gigas TaxID=1518452 RepID=A0A2P2I623_9CRUS
MWLERPIRGVMLDITGVLYESGAGAITGSVHAVDRLRASGLRVVLVSNESSQPTSTLVKNLNTLGYDWVTTDDVITPIPAVMAVLRQHALNPHLLVHPSVEHEFDDVVRAEEAKTCVVMGDADANFSFENMNSAFNCLMDMKQPKLYCLGKGRYYRHNGKLQLDVGCFNAALEFATGVTADIVGKPAKLYFQKALDHLNLPAEQVLMVGDDLFGDVVGATEVGCRAVLVRTGKFQNSWGQHAAPSFVADNLAHAVDLLLEAMPHWTTA